MEGEKNGNKWAQVKKTKKKNVFAIAQINQSFGLIFNVDFMVNEFQFFYWLVFK